MSLNLNMTTATTNDEVIVHISDRSNGATSEAVNSSFIGLISNSFRGGLARIPLIHAIPSYLASVFKWGKTQWVANRIYPVISKNLSQEALKKAYWGLGPANKWMELIDGVYHHLGMYAFDRGSHGGAVEPGFIHSMEESCIFTQDFLNAKIDADWYLLLHKHTCAHFNGGPAVLMGQEKVGVFRDSDDQIACNLNPSHYQVTPEARAEFQALDQELKREFGDSYGLGEMTFTDAAQTSTQLRYKAMSRAQVARIFNKFLTEFYQEIERATTPDQKLWAIAKIQQRLEWLHPVRDGTARTSTVLMNKFLTDCGFHPAILEYPHRSSSLSLSQWKQYLQEGLLKWEQLKARLNPET